MKELSHHLQENCYELLSECIEFDSDDSMRRIFDNGAIKPYSRFVHEQKNRDDRIRECIKGLKDRSREGKSVLALFLEVLSERYPDGDDTRAALRELADSIILAQKLENTTASHFIQQTVNVSTANQDSPERKQQEILVVWGQNDVAKIEMFAFLKGAGFLPVEWSTIAARTGKNSPSADEVLRAAFNTAQAVVMMFTDDDMAVSKEELKPDQKLYPQPRPDLIFIAGVASGIDVTRTILVALGKLRPFADLLGRHVILLPNKDESRHELMSRLRIAGCSPTKSDWTARGKFHNPSFYRTPQVEVKVITTDYL